MLAWQTCALMAALMLFMWTAIGYFALILGPWGRLASRYPVHQWSPTISRAWFVSLKWGLMEYGNCLTIDFSEDTLTVHIGLLMLPFHPPFTVPKSAIRNVHRGRLLFIPWITFWVDDCRFLLWGPNARTRFFDELV